MTIRLRKACLALTLAINGVACETALCAPSPEEALKLAPVQKDADYDKPGAPDAAKCSIKAEKFSGKTGWIVRDAAGQILRNFLDTNGDNVVDQWSYYKAGIEVYRDVDTNFNGKADQCRWLNVGGTRWGVDKNEDGQIEAWKVISAEEVSAEVVAAIATQDTHRFERLLATPNEINSLGIESQRSKELLTKVASAAADFAKLAREKKLLTPDSKWVYFGGGRPGLVPASGDGTADLVVYENVSAMIDTGGKNGQVEIGTFVRIGDTWRLTDVPAALTGAQGFTFFGAAEKSEEVAGTGSAAPSEDMLKLLKELEDIDKAMATASAPEQLMKLNARRADLVEKLAHDADTPEDQETWYRDLGDTVLAAVQTGTYPEGVERLERVAKELAENGRPEAASIVQFRLTKAKYFVAQQGGDNFAQVQERWLKDLEQFVSDHPTSADAADAMMELATAHEFAGSDAKALKWYAEIAKSFPKSPVLATAKGAQTRLESVGKQLNIVGKKFGVAGNTGLSNPSYKGKVVLLHYWSSDVNVCRAEIPQLQDMQAKYAKSGFAILSVSLDRDPKALQEYLSTKKLPWETIYEPGGITGRLATEMGIHTVPTMLLLDKQGRVINRGIHAAELDSELRKLLMTEPRQANRP